jgi:cell fate regulator YaaT (PSP1 superfamily)
MCCLAYEYGMYVDLKRDFPKVGKRVMTPQGEGKVVKANVLARTVTVETSEGKEVTFPAGDVKPAKSGET